MKQPQGVDSTPPPRPCRVKIRNDRDSVTSNYIPNDNKGWFLIGFYVTEKLNP